MQPNSEQSETADELSLTFYAAYQQHGEQRRYLGDGAGHVRLYKDVEKLREYLALNLSPADLERTVIHPIAGMIAVPELDAVDQFAMTPISTTPLLEAAPTAGELLAERTSRKRHKPKGAR